MTEADLRLLLFIKLIWGTFLAFMLAWDFHRSWRYEHGAPSYTIYMGAPAGHKLTYVLIDPLILPAMYGSFVVLILLIDPTGGGIILAVFLSVVLSISIYFTLLLLFMSLLRKLFSPRACATLWLLPVFLFYQPSILDDFLDGARWVINLPSDFPWLFPCIYLPVAIAVFGWKLLSHLLFRRRTMASACEITEGREPELFKAELERVSYLKPVKLCYCDCLSSPLSMGFYDQTRVTLLPRRDYTEQELNFIFRHEICHLQRCDIHTKVCLAFCLAFCGFDPLVWLAVRRAAEDLELACDELVLEGLGREERQAYARLLLMNSGKAPGFTSCLSAAGRTMRYRLKNVVEPRRRHPGTLLLATVMFLCVMGYGLVMFKL